MNRKVLTEQQPTMNPLRTEGVLHTLVLADGIPWEIRAVDEGAASVMLQLGNVMQLGLHPGTMDTSPHGNRYRLLVQVDKDSPMLVYYAPLASKDGGAVTCFLNPLDHWVGPCDNLLRLSHVFARQAQAHGGILIHGALAERNGLGIILTAPGGTGKTTASKRLPAPWHSLCDDTTLVVRDPQGNYWAHPWPTWSLFQNGGPGGTWNVQKAVPLKGIFLLAQAGEDRVERVGHGQAVSLLVECVGQVSIFTSPHLFKEEVRALHLERFNNLCALARVVPTQVLHICLTGAFWKEIEQTLGLGNGEETQGTISQYESESKSQSAG